MRNTSPAAGLLFLTSSLFLTSPTWAQQQSFVPTVIATPGAPSSVLFGVYGGDLVRSADLGKTWIPVYLTQAGLPQPPIAGFAIDALNSNNVYLATTAAAGTFWKSSDGGLTWAEAASGLPSTGPGIQYFKAFSDTVTYLYAQIGGSLYKSSDGAKTWILQSNLPTTSGTFVIAEAVRTRMFYIDTATLTVYSTFNEGGAWQPTSQQLTALVPPSSVISGIGVPYYDSNDLYVTVNFPGTDADTTTYASIDEGPFTDQTSTGLGPFLKILSGSTGPTYALTTPPNTFFISLNSGQSWQPLGSSGLNRFTMTAVDPAGGRTTLYGVETTYPSTIPVALVQSTDSGNSWGTIPATITPSIGKPVSSFNITVEQGAPYSVSFTVQTAESPVWQTPVTIAATGTVPITLAATSGVTPLVNTFTISSSGLLPGTYSSTITISAPQTYNKTVTVPVQLTVKPLGGLGPGYVITTAAGNGNPAGAVTTGVPSSVPIGDAKAVAIDPSGNLLISAGSRIWEITGGTLTGIAGTGVNATSGATNDPQSSSVADPDAITFDSSGAAYFTEFVPERVRKLVYVGNQSLSTALDLTTFNQPLGTHTVVLDPLKFMYITLPSGILNYNGAIQKNALTLTIPVVQPAFSNPYSMIEDGSGNFYVSDMGLNQIIEITPAGVESIFAGTGAAGFGGDGSPATQAMLNAPAGIAFDSQGTMYIADSGNNRIRTITADGNIHTIAGSGLPGFAGDGSAGDFASFSGPLGVAVDASGNVYVADTGNNRVRMLAPQNTPTPKPQALLGPNKANQLAPGALFSLYGTALAPVGYSFLVASARWPRSSPANSTGAGEVSVTINGVTAPLYYVSPTQINGQIPYETALGTATAVVTVDGSLAAQITFPVIAAEPDVLAQNGGSQAVAQNASEGYSLNTPTSPAHPGDVEVVYLSGIGLSNPPLTTGASAPTSAPLAVVNYPYQITLNGQTVPSCQYNFLGYAPGYTALVQADFCLPANLTGNLSLVITVNGQSSVPTIISVQ
jgi:uncharacterized protein (TIGR03437 family)